MLALIGVLLASTDPASLKNVRYSEAGDVQRIKAAEWRPADPRNGFRSVRFVAPGRMVLDWRVDGATCNFASRREGSETWALTIDCGSGPAGARWTWLPGGGARTSVFQIAAPQMPDAQVELARFDRDFAEVEKQYRASFRLGALRKLSGKWEDASWDTEVVLDPSRPALGGRPAQVAASPCLPYAAAPGTSPVICLSVAADGADKLMLVEQGERLFECEWDEGGDGALYDLAKGSRIFTRATPRP